MSWNKGMRPETEGGVVFWSFIIIALMAGLGRLLHWQWMLDFGGRLFGILIVVVALIILFAPLLESRKKTSSRP